MLRSLILSVAVVLSCAVVASADVHTGLVEPYLRIHSALAQDSMAPVKADAAKIAAEAATLGAPGKALAGAARELQSSADLGAARTAFAKLSDALVKFAESTDAPLGTDLNVAYCPMEKKSWVQEGTAISNPYGGKKMPRCGEIVKPVR